MNRRRRKKRLLQLLGWHYGRLERDKLAATGLDPEAYTIYLGLRMPCGRRVKRKKIHYLHPEWYLAA